jgi:hypothetical protein
MITLTLMFLAYWIPTLLAYHWNHRNRLAILVTNFFLGWTVLAWIVILIWACTSNRGPKSVTA